MQNVAESTGLTQSEIAAWLTVVVTFLGVIAALAGVWWQVRRQWLLHSATLVTQLDDRFNSKEWLAYRYQCAKQLEAHYRGGKDLDLLKNFPVLGFFENLAYMVRAGALDKKMVWNKFGWYVVGYYKAITVRKNALKAARQQEGDETIWEEFEWLYWQMEQIYRKRGVTFEGEAALQRRINNFLEWELSLLGVAEPGLNVEEGRNVSRPLNAAPITASQPVQSGVSHTGQGAIKTEKEGPR